MVICEKKLCSGCSACSYVCPHNAISMVRDPEGFFRPEIDEKKCVECGLCQKKCPVNKTEAVKPTAAYAAYTKDKEIRKSSSSGGIFACLAGAVIDEGGIVFGAGYGDGLKVMHKWTEDREGLKELMGSKYVQSDVSVVYEKLSESVKNGRKTLFVGTPCQCAAVRQLFGSYDSLIIADFICHGVPTPLLWEKYIGEEFCGAHSASFRDKKRGWEEFSMRIESDKAAYCKSLYNDPYLRLFLQNTILRGSCYECSWKGDNYASDITLADFWGISKVFPHMNDNKGVSVVVVRSEAGEKAFRDIRESLVVEKTKIETVANINVAYKESAHCPKNREEFFEDMKNGKSIKYLCDKYVREIPFSEISKARVKRVAKVLIGKVYKLKKAVMR